MTPPPSPGFAFVAGALDRADALRDDPAALRRLWLDARLLLLDGEGRARCVDGGGYHRDWRDDHLFLGMRDGRAWFALPDETGPADVHEPSIDLRTAADSWPADQATAFAQARAVLHWRARHRFCPVCGQVLRYRRAGWEGWCEACGQVQYPRTDPAVIMAVSDGERLLLGRQAGWPARRYSTLAGFVEPGETLEQTVARETLEESGVRVVRSRYLASQPWPFPGSLMLGFIAHAYADVPHAADELEDAQWFTAAQVGQALQAPDHADAPLRLSPPLSISRWLIQTWHAGLRA